MSRDSIAVGTVFCENFKARIRHGHGAEIRFDGAERIIFCRRFVRARDRVEQCRFPDIRQSNDSRAQHKARTLRRELGHCNRTAARDALRGATIQAMLASGLTSALRAWTGFGALNHGNATER